MVKTKMEGRVDTVELKLNETIEKMNALGTEMSSMKEEMSIMSSSLLEIQKFMAEWGRKVDRGELGTSAASKHSHSSKSSDEEPMTVQKPPQGGISFGGEGGGSDNRSLREVFHPRRLEMPLFSGDDPAGWLFRAERFFSINQIEESIKVATATIYLEGSALSWFQLRESRAPFTSWENFKVEILNRFRPPQYGSAHEELLSLRQTHTVAEYRNMFEVLSAPLKDLSDELLKGIFISGLSDEIKAEVRLIGPSSLGDSMALAQRVEERDSVLGGRTVAWTELRAGSSFSRSGINNEGCFGAGYKNIMGQASYSNKFEADQPMQLKNKTEFSSTGLPEKTSFVGNQPVSGTSSNQASPPAKPPFRHLTDTEMKAKMDRGLYFRCDERFVPGHRCRNKQLHILMVQDGEDGKEEGHAIEDYDHGNLGQKFEYRLVHSPP